jgi:tetratricopeptide (TPR) repeat protein
MNIIITPKRVAGLILCQTGLLVAGALALQVEPQVNPASLQAGIMNEKQQERIEESASASLFGQFRTSMADFLWMKTDKYLHNGVDLRGMTEREKKMQMAQVKTANDDGYVQHQDETTVVPSASGDWRGFYGALERQVQPYKNMEHHAHATPDEALPLFRLMTISNPHFIAGFKVGGAMMLKTKPKEAIAFIEEGVKKNPDNIELLVLLGGDVYVSNQKEYDRALPYLDKAITLAKQRDTKALTQDELDDYENAFVSAFRWAVLACREKGDHVRGRAYANEGLRYFPGDATFVRYLKQYGVP